MPFTLILQSVPTESNQASGPGLPWMHLLRYRDSAEHCTGQSEQLLHSGVLADDPAGWHSSGLHQRAAHVLAQMDWKITGFALLHCAIAHIKQELTAGANCCWGVRVANSLLSAGDISHSPFVWGSISSNYTSQLQLCDFKCRFMYPLKQVTLWHLALNQLPSSPKPSSVMLDSLWRNHNRQRGSEEPEAGGGWRVLFKWKKNHYLFVLLSSLQNISVRSVCGEVYCAKSGRKFSGQIQEKFLISDWRYVLSGSYRWDQPLQFMSRWSFMIFFYVTSPKKCLNTFCMWEGFF